MKRYYVKYNDIAALAKRIDGSTLEDDDRGDIHLVFRDLMSGGYITIHFKVLDEKASPPNAPNPVQSYDVLPQASLGERSEGERGRDGKGELYKCVGCGKERELMCPTNCSCGSYYVTKADYDRRVQDTVDGKGEPEKEGNECSCKPDPECPIHGNGMMRTVIKDLKCNSLIKWHPNGISIEDIPRDIGKGENNDEN